MAAAATIDHFAFNVEKAQLDKVVSWYLTALAPLKFEKIMEFPGATGLGADGKPDVRPLSPTPVFKSVKIADT